MPSITLTEEQVEQLRSAIRQGPSQVIGFDRNGERQKAFEFGHNSAKDHVYAVAKSIGLFPSRTYDEAKKQDEIADGYAPPDEAQRGLNPNALEDALRFAAGLGGAALEF